MAVFLLEYREDEDRQVKFCIKEASSPVSEDRQFYQWCHFNENLTVSNNINTVFF